MAATDHISAAQFGDDDEDDVAADAVERATVQDSADSTASITHGGDGTAKLTRSAWNERLEGSTKPDLVTNTPRYDQVELKANIAGTDRWNRKLT